MIVIVSISVSARACRRHVLLATCAVATACSPPAPSAPRVRAIDPVTIGASAEHAERSELPLPRPPPAALAEVALTSSTLYVHLAPVAHDPRAPSDAPARITAAVTREIATAGYATASASGPPDQAALDAAHRRAVVIASHIDSVAVARTGTSAEITCSVGVQIAPWHGRDGGEVWEAGTTAHARGSAKATTTSTPRQVALGVRDCLESAVRAATAREVVPFLRRLGDAG